MAVRNVILLQPFAWSLFFCTPHPPLDFSFPPRVQLLLANFCLIRINNAPPNAIVCTQKPLRLQAQLSCPFERNKWTISRTGLMGFGFLSLMKMCDCMSEFLRSKYCTALSRAIAITLSKIFLRFAQKSSPCINILNLGLSNGGGPILKWSTTQAVKRFLVSPYRS